MEEELVLIFLINSDNDIGLGRSVNGDCYPPLGIISLGTAIQAAFPTISLQLFDGQTISNQHIVDCIRAQRPTVVGISMYSASIRNTISLATAAKDVGAITILGNDHAIMHANTILTNVPEVDYICLNDVGEETMVAFIEYLNGARDVETVPLLAYRSSSEIRKTRSHTVYSPGRSLDSIPIPNRKLLDERSWDHYAQHFNRQARHFFKTTTPRVTTINRARGCAQMSRPCKYCGINNLSIRYSSGDVFWTDVRSAQDQVGANVFYEAFDSASSAPRILREWLAARPEDLTHVAFKMYAQAFESTPTVVDIFRGLNVFCVNMGLDSGDDTALKLLKGPRHSVESHRTALKRYSDAGIEVYASFVLFGLGNADATKSSLDKTMEFIRWMTENTSVVGFDCALLYPDKNAPIGSWIWGHGSKSDLVAEDWAFLNEDALRLMGDKWRSALYLDPTELCSDFAVVCGVDPALLVDYATQISAMSSKAGLNYGLTAWRAS
jgi:anaerobic magnesium-protoporphyrin IX monomethyl ester cyclase